MVAPLSGARYSSGAIFRTKLVIIIIMVAPLRGAERDRADSSGAIFRIKLVIIIKIHGGTTDAGIQVAPSSGQNW